MDAVFDGMMTLDSIHTGLRLLRRGGTLVSYGELQSLGSLFRNLLTLLGVNLVPGGKRFKLYGTSAYFVGNPEPFERDWGSCSTFWKAAKSIR